MTQLVNNDNIYSKVPEEMLVVIFVWNDNKSTLMSSIEAVEFKLTDVDALLKG